MAVQDDGSGEWLRLLRHYVPRNIVSKQRSCRASMTVFVLKIPYSRVAFKLGRCGGIG